MKTPPVFAPTLLGLLISCSLPVFADVTFTGPAVFSAAPTVTTFGTSLAGAGTFTSAYSLIDLANGFKLSSATFTYTAALADVGKTLNLSWAISRPDTILQTGGLTDFTSIVIERSHLDGTLILSSGMGFPIPVGFGAPLEEITSHLSLATPSNGAIAGVNPLVFVADGSTANPFDVLSPDIPQLAFVGTNSLRQSFGFNFIPTVLGQSFTLSLPNSSTSTAVSNTPEPGSMALLGGLCVLGFHVFGRLRRRHMKTFDSNIIQSA